MKTRRKSAPFFPVFPGVSRRSQAGNAMIYVLIAIVLFGALTFIVARQSDDSETGGLNAEQTEIVATQLVQTSMQLKQAVDQMLYSGSEPDTLDFTTPDDEPAFSTAPYVHKVFHPSGGGVILQPIPLFAVDQESNDPPARWYIGRFNNVSWSADPLAEEIIMVAHQISEPVCRAINQKLLGNPAPLVTTANPRNIFVDDVLHSGTNEDFTSAACPTCENVIAGCVEGPSEVLGENIRSFFSIIVSR